MVTQTLNNEEHGKIALILPVYNAFSDTLECIESVARNIDGLDKVYVIDDCSSEGEVKKLVPEQYLQNSAFCFLRNHQNLGFVGTCNFGLKLATAELGACDIILLNSDTVVTKSFALKLRAAAYSKENVGTVTSLTNNGTICSVPRFGVDNALPEGLSIDEFADLIESVSKEEYAELPTCVGHCVYVTRALLDKTVLFDKAFGAGYGEENDLSCRARKAGFIDIVDDKTFIFHKGKASFGEKQLELSAKNTKLLTQRHPHYFDEVSRFCNANPLRAMQERILDGLVEHYNNVAPKRVLSILQNGPHVARRDELGGTELHVRDIITNAKDVSHWSLVPTKRCYYLTAHMKTADGKGLEREYILDLGKTALKSILKREYFDLVHLHHSRYFDHEELSAALAEHGNYVVSFHDFILVCPRFHLYTPFRKVCNGHECAKSCGYKDDYIAEYRSATDKLLTNARRLVCFSDSTRQYVESILGKSFNWEQIPHGMLQFVKEREYLPKEKPTKSNPLKVAFTGFIPQHKGSLIIADLIKHKVLGSSDIPVEWHVLGKLFLDAGYKVINHGAYERDEVNTRLTQINPHLVIILSICPETYCLTLDEAWQAGIPVISTPLGAPAERMKKSEAGWILDELSYEALLEKLNSIVNNWSDYERAFSNLKNNKIISVSEEVASYAALYEEALALQSKSDIKLLFSYLKNFGLEHHPDLGLLGRVGGELINKSIWILDSVGVRGHLQRAFTRMVPERVIRELKSIR